MSCSLCVRSSNPFTVIIWVLYTLNEVILSWRRLAPSGPDQMQYECKWDAQKHMLPNGSIPNWRYTLLQYVTRCRYIQMQVCTNTVWYQMELNPTAGMPQYSMLRNGDWSKCKYDIFQYSAKWHHIWFSYVISLTFLQSIFMTFS